MARLYRQLTFRLRVHRAGGGQWESTRPRAKSGGWLDLPPNAPTLVEIDETRDMLDVADLIRMGAIARYEPPTLPAPDPEPPPEGGD